MSALASVPEQLPHYVLAVADREALAFESCVAYVGEGAGVVVAYPSALAPRPSEGPAPWTTVPEDVGRDLDRALDDLEPRCHRITVMAPFVPERAPADARRHVDVHWELPLPAPPLGPKLDYALRRAARDVDIIHDEPWGPEHRDMTATYVQRPDFAAGTKSILSRIDRYVASKEGVRLLSARGKDGRLAACCVGDLTSLATAFYMFAFRRPDAPPGTADLLLNALVRKAEDLGCLRVNLGLGVTPGVAFFKRKWPAMPSLPCVETSWECRGGRGVATVPKEAAKDGGVAGLLRRLFRKEPADGGTGS
jgi:hypothetical protein